MSKGGGFELPTALPVVYNAVCYRRAQYFVVLSF
jgi:hypothetical protein